MVKSQIISDQGYFQASDKTVGVWMGTKCKLVPRDGDVRKDFILNILRLQMQVPSSDLVFVARVKNAVLEQRVEL
jgi:hypothetical protein